MSKARDIARAGTALANVDATELGYLDGVTSAVQTQIDSKLATSTAASTYLTQSSASSTYQTAAISTNAQTGTSYTLVLADAGKLVELNNAAAITLTIPTNASVAFPVGTQVNILQTGAGQVTVSGAGVTINGTPGLKLRTQWSSATLVKRATDTWVLLGDLSA